MKERIELPNQERIRTFGGKETYKYLTIVEADTIKQVKMKEKKYLRRTIKRLETKLNSRNLMKSINTWTVPLISYSGQFLKLAREELQQMEYRTRKLKMMHKVLHLRDHIDIICYQEKKEKEDSPELKITLMHQYANKKKV